jgi:hypothetical protein
MMKNKEYTITEIVKLFKESIKEPAEKGKLKGKIVRFQIADSFSFYIITKEDKKYAYLKRANIVDFDNYTEPVLGEEGAMEINRLISHINLDYKVYKYFDKK